MFAEKNLFGHTFQHERIGENNYSTAILLNRADAFTATEMGLFIGVGTSATANNFDWYSYGSSQQPNLGTTTGANFSTSMKTLFNNSVINIAINNVQYLQNYSTLRLRKVPTIQTGIAFGTVGSITAGTNNAQDSFNGEVDGFYPLVPTLQLSGTSKIDCSLVLPNALTDLPQSTVGFGYIMLAFRGFLSLGASNLNK
jgi:hypothetical protein